MPKILNISTATFQIQVRKHLGNKNAPDWRIRIVLTWLDQGYLSSYLIECFLLWLGKMWTLAREGIIIDKMLSDFQY